MKRSYVLTGLAVIVAMTIASPAIGGPSLKKLVKKVVKKEVAKQIGKATGPAGPAGANGAPGTPGLNGVDGAPGPTYGESHAAASEAPMASPFSLAGSTQVTTPIAGKLYVFGNIEAAVACTGNTPAIVALFVDTTRLPGTNYGPAAGATTKMSFGAVTAAPVAAGTHTVTAKGDCLSGGAVPTTNTVTTGGYGVIVLGA
jgi:hypothetical protein